MTDALSALISTAAQETSFSGVVEVVSKQETYCEAWGFRDRVNAIPNLVTTRFGIASGTKGFTALGIATLIEAGEIKLETTAVSILGPSFDWLHPQITIANLWAHTSGMGDHYDEDEIQTGVDDFFLAVPVQNLVSPFDYLPLLKDKPQKFPPGEQAVYSNGGYVVLAMIIEVLAKQSFQQFIHTHVLEKAGMADSGFFRSDALPANTALGYLADSKPLKTNLFNLPVVGSGDGGMYSTLEDMSRFWERLLSFQIVGREVLEPLVAVQNRIEGAAYGFGFWLEDDGDLIALEGYDAGVSFYSAAARNGEIQYTVISNDRLGAWPIVKVIQSYFQSNAQNTGAD